MRFSTILSLVLSFAFAIAAVVGVRGYLRDQAALLAQVKVEKPAPKNTIVVAAQPMRFGKIVEPSSLKIIEWPNEKLPEGAFKTVEDVIGDTGKSRYVMSAIEADEPVLAQKLTGPGQRATLSAALSPGMKAVSIRVNDVLGVAGFVLPGDRVDIMLTRENKDAPTKEEETYTDVLLQGVKVLAVDQLADDRADKPDVVKAVTLEVSTAEAQKLTLAANVGTLSLALRNIASADVENVSAINISDLGGGPTAQALLQEKMQAEREQRINNLENLVRKVGETVSAKVGDVNTRVDALKDELNKKPAPVIVQAPQPVVLVEKIPEMPKTVPVGVYRNVERTEYQVLRSLN